MGICNPSIQIITTLTTQVISLETHKNFEVKKENPNINSRMTATNDII